ncbi:MAG: SwmB domain-containing protein [Acidobacteria bacterium]|nr:SwmB domain-containing protein [Acidobacteriota bacterium]
MMWHIGGDSERVGSRASRRVVAALLALGASLACPLFGAGVAHAQTPQVQSAGLAADGLTLTLTFDETLNEASEPDGSAFVVEATPAGGSEVQVDLAASGAVDVAGSNVVLELATPIAHNDGSVKVSYTLPQTGSVIENEAGDDADSFADQAVTNNSAVPRVSIEAVHADATPDIAVPQFRFTRSNTSPTALTVAIAISQDAAYVSRRRNITIPADAAMKVVAFGGGYTGNKSGDLTVTLTGDVDHLPALAPDNAATVEFKVASSGDTLSVALEQAAWSVDEGDAQNVEMTLAAAVGVAQPRNEVVFFFSTEAGTATSPGDYGALSESVSVAPGDWTASGGGYAATKEVAVETLEDDQYEGDETFTVKLENAPGAIAIVRIAPTAATITIDDDDTLGVTGVAVTSAPAATPYYATSEEIEFTVTFNGAVTVTGTPQLGFALGTGARQADYESGSDSTELVFSYTVTDGDDDHDGISWSAGSLALNGGAIKFMSAEEAAQVDATLTHAAQGALADHKVDTTAPSLEGAAVNGAGLTLTFSEALNPAALAGSAFTVKVDGGAGDNPTDVVVSGSAVMLTLAAAVPAGVAVTLSYEKPGTNNIRDLSGKEADAFGDREVTNTGRRILPVGSNRRITAPNDSDLAFHESDFGYFDAGGRTLASVRIVNLPAQGRGVLTLGGLNVAAGTSVTRVQIDAGSFRYRAPAGAIGTGYASFDFRVSNGVDESASDYTMTIDVTGGGGDDPGGGNDPGDGDDPGDGNDTGGDDDPGDGNDTGGDDTETPVPALPAAVAWLLGGLLALLGVRRVGLPGRAG